MPEFLFSQTDFEFWFAAPEVTHEITAPPAYDTVGVDEPVFIGFTTNDGPAQVTISVPADPSFVPVTFAVYSGSYFQYDLTNFLDRIECKPSNAVLGNGLLITSDKPVNAIYQIQNGINSESFSLKGRNALGYEFIIPAQDLYPNFPYCDPPARNRFSIVATEDLTLVKVLPKKPLVGHPGLDTVFITLNRGQTWTGEAVSNDTSAHLGGSFVFSDKPIAVTVADDAIRPYDANPVLSIDLAGDQLIPKNICGTEYVVTFSVAQSSKTNRILIYSFENSTIINRDGSFLCALNKGQKYMYITPTYSNFSDFITSNKPILVYFFGRADGWSTEVYGQVFPPIPCAGSRVITTCRTGPDYFVGSFEYQIVTKTGNQLNFTCSDPTLQVLLDMPDQWFDVAGSGGQYKVFSSGGGFQFWSATTFSNSTGNFQLNVSDVLQTTYRGAVYSNFSSLNLGPDRTLCTGDTIILDAGYGRTSYLWNTGATTQTIQVTNPGAYYVTVVSGDCTLQDTIVISPPDNTPPPLPDEVTVCPGDSVMLDAGPGRSWYQWNTGDSSQTIYAKQSGSYWVTVPVFNCSNTMSVTSTVVVPDSVNLGSDVTICQGDSILLDAGPGKNSYLWSTGETTQAIWAKITGMYSVIANYKSCDFFDTVIVTAAIVPVVDLGPDDSICSGESASFDAGFCSGCIYEWKDVSTGLILGANQTYTTGTPGTYCVNVTNSNGCNGKDTVMLTINPGNPVIVTILSSANVICAGNQVTFTATSTNQGLTPVYQWQVNGVNTGINDSIFACYPVAGDMVSCIMTSSGIICISNNPDTSNIISITVNPNLPVSVSVIPSDNPFCHGTPVTFTATPENGGTTPLYQWKVNGANVGINNQAFTYNPASLDLVSCILTSSEVCTSNNPDTTVITMAGFQGPPADVIITATPSPSCQGIPVTFTATPIHGGSDPSFQWQVNGICVGTNTPLYSYVPAPIDLVSCTMTSNLACVSNNPVSSIQYQVSISPIPAVTFTPCFDTITVTNAKPIRLKGGLPLGGTYSGPGVNAVVGIFTPSMAGIGIKEITYSYTNAELCTANFKRNLVVLPAQTFSCGNDLTDVRDNQKYKTIQIGTQCWFAENLRYGNPISFITHQSDNCIPERYESTLGGPASSVYQWDEIMQYVSIPGEKGLCPPNWHIPSESEWQVLISNWTNSAFAASPLKYSGFSGFNAVLTGVVSQNQGWNFSSFATLFWTSDSNGPYKAWAHGMNDPDPSVSRYPSIRSNAFSVRCLKD